MLEGLLGNRGEKKPSAGVGLDPIKHPVIGLALGGGAARGFAHIGALRALAAHGIVPQIVVGTSIGAAVGGCYVSGHLDAFEEWARSLQPRSLFSYLDIQLNGSGLIGGSKLAAQLTASLGDVQIEALPMKFAAVGTEINTGHEIWMTRGNLVEAISASYALPGIFSPVLVGDRWLVDGALVNPVPVSVARALGAEIVIAVNLSGDSFGHGTVISAQASTPKAVDDKPADNADEETMLKKGIGKFFASERALKRQFFGSTSRPGISTVMVEAFNIMQDRITRARLAGDPPDILISPRVGRIGWFDFHRAADLIAQGQRATERAIESIDEVVSLLDPSVDGAPSSSAPAAAG